MSDILHNRRKTMKESEEKDVGQNIENNVNSSSYKQKESMGSSKKKSIKIQNVGNYGF